ncbi:QRFP-like peptide receptor [Frankliniella occidentalis]|uniref:QRFP-like peptide receptor n=1 Tax=Frankliniella occidentalis TaxID=133901 RepID=A0A9C6TUR1_FRAOC|nr:QRFP-like peptide receptor [Frankliniella occidentalis]
MVCAAPWSPWGAAGVTMALLGAAAAAALPTTAPDLLLLATPGLLDAAEPTEDFGMNDEYGNYTEADLIEFMNQYDWLEVVPTMTVYCLIMLLGLAGNALIIFTTQRYRRMQSTTNVFLSSLAVADLLLIIVCIPVKLAKLMSFTWEAGYFLCKFVHYMQNVSAMCSVFTLTAMSIERYYAIIHPMRVKYLCSLSQARKICACIWLLAFVLASPILQTYDHKQVGDDSLTLILKRKVFWCIRNLDEDGIAMVRFNDVYSLVVILVVPTAIMVFAYSVICWEVWHVMLQRYHMTSGKGLNVVESIPLSKKRQVGFRESLKKGGGQIRLEEETQTVKQVIKMLVAVVVVFVICWAPLLIEHVLTSYGVIAKNEERTGDKVWLKYMSIGFHLLSYFNSCVNPIVYGFMSRSFRESFRQALCRCCRSGRRPGRQPSTNTRTTSLRLNDTRQRTKAERRRKVFIFIC